MSRADIHQFGWPNSELIMPISRVNRPQSGEWFDYKIPMPDALREGTPQNTVIGLGPIFWTSQKMDCIHQNVTKNGSVLQCKSDFFVLKMQNFLDFAFYRRGLPHFK